MSIRLPEQEIRRRLTKLRNYERLYPNLRREHEDLKRKYRALQKEFAEYKRSAEARMQGMELRIEQLTQMVFGRKNRKDEDGDDDHEVGAAPSAKMRPRPPASFRRPTPPQDAVTECTMHPLHACPDCGTPLRKKETVTRFVEDIPLPKKVVTEQHIERGFCPHCRKTKSAVSISPQIATLGENVRLYVLFAITVSGQTFEKVRTHLQAVHGLAMSDGEIATILDEGHRKFLPAKNDIDERIRSAPVAHYDETSYPVQHGEQGDFAWVKTSATGPETLFLLGRTRGKGNAEEIRGPPSDQAAVTDDYGAYDSLFHRHGLCWAHPLRKFRDLARSGVLPEEQHRRCRFFYEQFATLEKEVAITRAAPLSGEERTQAARRFSRRIATLMAPDAADCPKIATLKQTFLDNTDKYLLCVLNPVVPMTNNQAERRIRHLVIKRLLSFGSRTQKGAQIMETLLSVLLTLWWSKPKDYFGELRALAAA